MSTRSKQLIKASSDEEDDEEVIPQTAPGAGTSVGEGKGALPTEQRQEPDLATPPSLEKECRSCSCRFADLLATAAALAAKLVREEPVKGVDGPEPRRDDSAAAVSHT
ncbi:unnamed protein product [Lampetra fluviatilis]